VGNQCVRVNEIVPALLMSEMVRGLLRGPNAIPLDPVIAKPALDHVGQPEDGAAAVLFLCSKHANYVTGMVLPVDGAFLLHNAGSA
jgi:NAD(P)-dependent dehydrogenase (short-subunit alcohol dehydrogenase family)